MCHIDVTRIYHIILLNEVRRKRTRKRKKESRVKYWQKGAASCIHIHPITFDPISLIYSYMFIL
jgi:hypothetical protein